MDKLKGNPFTVTTPESMTADEVKELFVKVLSDYPKVYREGHIFLHGPRGSGKSMIFRYLQPDCQRLDLNVSLSKLEFYSVYVPLKNTDLKITELKRLDGHPAAVILNEHFMTMFMLQRTFQSLLKQDIENTPQNIASIRDFATGSFTRLLLDAGGESPDFDGSKLNSVESCLSKLEAVATSLFKQVIRYLKRLSFSKEVFPFEGPLCGYLDFLYPMFTLLRALPFMPEAPFFLLVDDADNLNLTQTKILNSWVSSRTTSIVSIKISTQLTYKTYRTLTGNTIDSVHDFSEINISTVYTSFKDTYKARVKEIVSKRLSLARLDRDPERFFPPDLEQEKQVKKMGEDIRARWETEGRGYRPSDDVTRYARPEYMKSLAGISKSSSTYSYAGFDQLVHISSGVVRYFLEAAANMFNVMKSKEGNAPIKQIPPEVQSKAIRELSDEFFFHEFDRLRDDLDTDALPLTLIKKLSNLIEALGGTFREILLSNRSERRVFSIAISDEPSNEVLEVLKMGERLGYIQTSAIGNKEGTGRTRLYILNRRLAPHFNLDPTSFAGYLFVKNEVLEQALRAPNVLLRKIKAGGLDDIMETRQLKLFEEGTQVV